VIALPFNIFYFLQVIPRGRPQVRSSDGSVPLKGTTHVEE